MKKNKTNILCILTMLVILLVASMSLQVNAAKTTLSTTKQSVTKGDSFTLTVKNINPKKVKVTVSSSKKGIVKVGKVTKKKSYDTIKITAKKKGTTALTIKVKQKGKRTITLTCKVTVETPKLSVTKKSLKTGSSFTLKLTGTNRKVTFKSSSKNVKIKKSSNQKVKVTAKKAGKYKIKAKLAKKTYTCNVTVTCKKHNYTSKVTKAATCAKSGTMTYTCKNCKKTKIKTIKSTRKHTYKLTSENAATCMENGKKTYTCTVCKKKNTKTIKSIGHKYKEHSITSVTCTEDSVKTSKCSACGDIKKEVVAKATGHMVVIDEPAVAATCTATGFMEASHCSVCNTILKTAEPVAKKPHTYDAGAVTKEATCTETGIKTYTCTVCGNTKEETIEMKEHNYEEIKEQRYVVDMPAYDDDEYVGKQFGWIHYPCGFFTTDGEEINHHLGEDDICDPAGKYGYANYYKPVYKTVHHAEKGHFEDVTTVVKCKDCGKQKKYVVDKAAYDEEVVAGYLHGWKHDSCDFFTTDLDEMHKHLVENCPDDLKIDWNANGYRSPSKPEWRNYFSETTSPVYVTIHHAEEGHFE